MNYVRIYNKLVQRCIERKQFATDDSYMEKHHIIPKCLGGSDQSHNIVYMTPEEHYHAHLLLVKMHPKNSSLVFAVQSMGRTSTKTRGRNAREMYGWIRRRLVAAATERSTGIKNSQFGSRWITNGQTNAKLSKEAELPKGWWLGRSVIFSNESMNSIIAAQKRRKRQKHSDATINKIRTSTLKRYSKLNED